MFRRSEAETAPPPHIDPPRSLDESYAALKAARRRGWKWYIQHGPGEFSPTVVTANWPASDADIELYAARHGLDPIRVEFTSTHRDLQRALHELAVRITEHRDSREG